MLAFGKKRMKWLCISSLVLVVACVTPPTPPSEEEVQQLLVRSLELMRSYDREGGRGKLESARAALDLLREVSPTDPRVLDAIGCVEWRRGYPDEAMHFFRRAIEVNQSYARAYGHLALVAQENGDIEVARELLATAVRLDPGDYRSRNNWATLLTDQSRARREFLKALHAAAQQPEVILHNLK